MKEAMTGTALRSVLADEAIGAIEYILNPNRGRIAFGGPFNGQHSRQEMFWSIVAEFTPAAIVETGTYLDELSKKKK